LNGITPYLRVGHDKKAKAIASELPALSGLHERHVGLTQEVCAANAQAAAVCLDRHHQPPTTVEVVSPERRVRWDLRWEPADERARRAWANADDATEDGACAVAMAVVEVELGLTAIQRAETKTGADYYLGHEGDDTLETAYRLEVAGSDRGDTRSLKSRLSRKVRQTRQGKSNLPAIASVVGFRAGEVHLRVDVDTSDE
jgi:hypothetical protein